MEVLQAKGDKVAVALNVQLVRTDSEGPGNFLPCGFTGAGNGLLLRIRRLRDTEPSGDFLLRQVQVFSPSPDGGGSVNDLTDDFMRNKIIPSMQMDVLVIRNDHKSRFAIGTVDDLNLNIVSRCAHRVSLSPEY